MLDPPNNPWVSSVVIRVPESLPATGDVLVRIKYRDVASNRVRVGIGEVGGGPPDDVTAIPTPGLPNPSSLVTATNLSSSDVQTILQQAFRGNVSRQGGHDRRHGSRGKCSRLLRCPAHPLRRRFAASAPGKVWKVSSRRRRRCYGESLNSSVLQHDRQRLFHAHRRLHHSGTFPAGHQLP